MTASETATVRIPTPLRKYVAGQSEVAVRGATAGAALRELVRSHPDLESLLFDEDGGLRTFVNVFVGERNVRTSGGLDHPLSAGEVVSIVPAVAGGAR